MVWECYMAWPDAALNEYIDEVNAVLGGVLS
jgi:hypothetical protein